jgi:uncharacterized membrane protein YedE/YeeE
MTGPIFDSGATTAGALAAAFAIGLAFGWTLERAGLGQANKLAGQFYFVDFTVFKVMFSAILTASLGAYGLAWFGLLDLSRVYVPETYVLPQLLGGFVFGVGFAAAGLCPGTSCVAAATGRVDGLAVMLGMLLGSVIVGLAFGSLAAFYGSTAQGRLTLPEALSVPYGLVLALLTVFALAAFGFLERLERRRTRKADPSGGERSPFLPGSAGSSSVSSSRAVS